MTILLLSRRAIILWTILISLSEGSKVCELCTCYGNRTDCSKRGLTDVPSPWPNSTVWLDLSRNEITVIDSRAFLGLDKLIHLDLSWNAIVSINNRTFSGLSELEYLNLNENPLRYASGFADGAFAPLVKLKDLHLITSECPQKPIDTYLQSLQSLKALSITLSEEGRIGDKLKNLRHLDSLTLTTRYCNSGKLDEDDASSLFGLRLRRLSLRNAGLSHLDPRFLRNFNQSLVKLDLSCNALDNLPSVIEALRGSPLETLLLDDAIDSFLPVEMNATFFSALGSIPLKILSTARNQYLQLDVGADLSLYRMTNLRYLRLGYNQVLFRSTQSKETAIQAAMYLLFNVTVLDINGLFSFIGRSGSERNSKFCREADPLFSDLKSAWEDDTLHYPPPTSFWIWFMAAAFRLKFENELTLPPAITRLYAANLGGIYDTLSCNDRKIYAKNNLKIVDLSHGSFGGIVCNVSGLSSVMDISLAQTGLTSFNSAYFSVSSMPLLNTLDLHGNFLGSFIESKSSTSVFSNMRGVLFLDMSANGISIMHREALFGLDNVTFLNFSRNSITSWDAFVSPLTQLKVLDISWNQIGAMSRDVMADLDSQAALVPGFTVNMTSNPIKCSCDTFDFIQWLTTTRVIHYVTSCADGSTARLLDTQLLRELHWQCKGIHILIAVVSALPALLLPVVLSWACKWRIRYIYYKCKRVCRRRVSTCGADDVEVYVCYHENDINTAKKLCAFLEHTAGIGRVVTRHSVIVGYYELEQIATLIDECNVLVLLISPEGLNDSKFEFEFYMALEKGVRCILPIVVNESFDLTTLPRALRKLLMSNSYLRSPSASHENQEYNLEEASSPQWRDFFFVFEACLANMIERQVILSLQKMTVPARRDLLIIGSTSTDGERLIP